ncbi:hypothetical protein [Methanobrevibacter sp.]|uniref:hypothetical protein n=1 Tax=Methanobrevibacter sp. TaxID=66852 RepID=UPI0025DA2FA4|nr:hypothetical protein [Methanobrevibacter sp.]MBQ6513032.1 hypothetical protein [Methanobrevibacter sp.]
MVNTSEEILLTMNGQDNASQMFANIDKNAQSMASSISAAMSKVNSGLMNLSQVGDNVVQSLTGKSALDNILGSASKNETNMVLLENMLEDVEANYDSFYKTVDTTTDKSLTSMQELIPALNALNAATGATDKELENITPNVANFGAAVLAQTGSVDRAQQAMMDLSKGYKGAYASLDQYGITEDALAREGYNEGDGLEKYMDAVTKVVGSTDKLMETNQGLDALIGKSFSRAGKKIGNEFLPIIKDVKRGFIDLDSSLGGAIAGSILLGEAGIEAGNRIMWNVSTAAQGVRDLKEGFGLLRDAIKGAGKAAEETGDVINTLSNASDIASGAAGAGGAVGAGAQAVKGASKGEKALEGGMDALLMADMVKGNKSSNNELAKWLREVEKSDDLYERMAEFNLEKRAERASKSMGVNPKKYLDNVKKDTKGLEEALSKSSEFMYDDALLKEWEASGQTFTGAIKDKTTGFKNKLTGAFSTLRNFDYKGTLLSPFTKMKSGLTGVISSIKGFSFGGALQSSLEKGFGGIGNIASSIKGKFSSLSSTLSGINISDSFKNFDSKLYQSIKGFSFKDSLGGLKESIKGLRGTAEVIDEVEDVAVTLKGADAIGDGMMAAAAAGDAAAAAGPAMEAGAAGAEAAAVGATGLSAAFTSMIVPALALAAVIIIMIPILAVIAAEAMIVLRLLAELMEALSFDSINLDGAVKGIQSITTALLWVGAAMLALTAVNIATQIAMVTSFFLGLTGPLEAACDALLKAAGLLRQFSGVGIDASVATNIQNITSSLSSIATAMTALTWSNIVTGFSDWIAGALGFGSVTEGLTQAKDDIIKASSIINEFSGITPLDDSVANNIQNVCDSLASVGNAMSALRSIRDGQNWDDLFGELMSGLFGEGVDIQQALINVKDDIIEASQALAQFTNITEIPEGISENIKKVSDTLTSVNEAFETLRGMRDNSNWDEWMQGLFGGTDIASALEQIKNDLITASQKLAALSGLSEISEDTTNKIKLVGDGLAKVSEVCNTLSNLPPMEGFDSSTITTAVTNVQTAATELAKLNQITFDGAAADTILGAIQTTLENVKTTLASASGFSEPATNIGSQIVSGVKSGLSPLTSTIQGAVSSATGAAASTGWTGGSRIGTSTTNGFKSSLKLASVMTTEMAHVKTAVDNGISAAKTAAESGAQEVVAAFKSGINVGSPGDIARAMKQELIYTKDFILAAYSPLKEAAYSLGQNIVKGFGSPSLDFDMFMNGGTLTADYIGALQTTISRAPDKQDNRPVTIIVSEGAVKLDARNYTTKEAQGLMITAFEGMDNITKIDVNGV